MARELGFNCRVLFPLGSSSCSSEAQACFSPSFGLPSFLPQSTLLPPPFFPQLFPWSASGTELPTELPPLGPLCQPPSSSSFRRASTLRPSYSGRLARPTLSSLTRPGRAPIRQARPLCGQPVFCILLPPTIPSSTPRTSSLFLLSQPNTL